MWYGEDVIDSHANLKMVKGDIRDQDLLKKVIPGHDAVIHLACISNDPSFEMDPKLGESINLDAFQPLVEISKASGVKRFIYASSSSVYGVRIHNCDNPTGNCLWLFASSTTRRRCKYPFKFGFS
jgi:nucleoside-diphosphate-sugar epimerase